MPVRSLTYQQSIFKRYHNSQRQTFLTVLPTRWRQKSTDIDTEQNCDTVTIHRMYTTRSRLFGSALSRWNGTHLERSGWVTSRSLWTTVYRPLLPWHSFCAALHLTNVCVYIIRGHCYTADDLRAASSNDKLRERPCRDYSLVTSRASLWLMYLYLPTPYHQN